MVASSNAEAGHASNEHAVPTHLIGIVDIENQVLKLIKREDYWIQRDISEYQQLELHRLSKQETMETDSGDWNSLHQLTQFSFEKFQYNLKGSYYYTSVSILDGEIILGHNIICKKGSPSTSIFITIGGRCPLPECIAMDYQCCHELANDNYQFVLGIWGTRYWCDKTYRSKFGDYGYHIALINVTGSEGSHTTNAKQGNDCNGNACHQLQKAMTGEGSNENKKKGTADEVDVLKVIAGIEEKEKIKETTSMIYNKPTTSFQPLAEDISRQPELANILHGFIIKAHKFLCGTK